MYEYLCSLLCPHGQGRKFPTVTPITNLAEYEYLSAVSIAAVSNTGRGLLPLAAEL